MTPVLSCWWQNAVVLCRDDTDHDLILLTGNCRDGFVYCAKVQRRSADCAFCGGGWVLRRGAENGVGRAKGRLKCIGRRIAGKGDLKRKGEVMCNENKESKCRMKRR